MERRKKVQWFKGSLDQTHSFQKRRRGRSDSSANAKVQDSRSIHGWWVMMALSGLATTPADSQLLELGCLDGGTTIRNGWDASSVGMERVAGQDDRKSILASESCKTGGRKRKRKVVRRDESNWRRPARPGQRQCGAEQQRTDVQTGTRAREIAAWRTASAASSSQQEAAVDAVGLGQRAGMGAMGWA